MLILNQLVGRKISVMLIVIKYFSKMSLVLGTIKRVIFFLKWQVIFLNHQCKKETYCSFKVDTYIFSDSLSLIPKGFFDTKL